MVKTPYTVHYSSSTDRGWLGGTAFILSVSPKAAWRQCLRVRRLARQRHLFTPVFDRSSLLAITWKMYRDVKRAVGA